MSACLQRFLGAALAACLCHSAFAQPISPSLLSQPLSREQFASCVQNLAQQTQLSGRPLSRTDFERFAAAAQYDDRVRQSMLVTTAEPTFWWDELAATTDEERVQQGRAVLARDAQTLQRIESQFGVPKEIIVAIYGIETNYGPSQGRRQASDTAASSRGMRPSAGP